MRERVRECVSERERERGRERGRETGQKKRREPSKEGEGIKRGERRDSSTDWTCAPSTHPASNRETRESRERAEREQDRGSKERLEQEGPGLLLPLDRRSCPVVNSSSRLRLSLRGCCGGRRRGRPGGLEAGHGKDEWRED